MTEAGVPMREKGKYASIEIGRGLASALVVFHHAGNIMSQPRFYGSDPFDGHLRNFNVGVDFFFVLSGFIIAWIHWADIGQSGRLKSYASKRFLRIYPPYWGVLLPLIALYQVFPQAGVESQRDPINIGLSLLLLPFTAQPVLGVAWTLTHEIFFYVVFAGIILAGRKALIFFPLWALAIIAGHFAGPLNFPLSFFLNPFNLEFIMGVGAAWLLKNVRIPAPMLVASVGALTFILLMLFAVNIQDDNLVGRLAFGISSLLFVLGAVEVERHRKVALPRALLFFGASSYAVYLVHPVALSFCIQVVKRLAGNTMSLEIIAIIIALMGIVAGCLYHILLEKRLTSWVRSVFNLGPNHTKTTNIASKEKTL